MRMPVGRTVLSTTDVIALFPSSVRLVYEALHYLRFHDFNKTKDVYKHSLNNKHALFYKIALTVLLLLCYSS